MTADLGKKKKKKKKLYRELQEARGQSKCEDRSSESVLFEEGES